MLALIYVLMVRLAGPGVNFNSTGWTLRWISRAQTEGGGEGGRVRSRNDQLALSAGISIH